jgi:hypothetical protein
VPHGRHCGCCRHCRTAARLAPVRRWAAPRAHPLAAALATRAGVWRLKHLHALHLRRPGQGQQAVQPLGRGLPLASRAPDRPGRPVQARPGPALVPARCCSGGWLLWGSARRGQRAARGGAGSRRAGLLPWHLREHAALLRSWQLPYRDPAAERSGVGHCLGITVVNVFTIVNLFTIARPCCRAGLQIGIHLQEGEAKHYLFQDVVTSVLGSCVVCLIGWAEVLTRRESRARDACWLCSALLHTLC